MLCEKSSFEIKNGLLITINKIFISPKCYFKQVKGIVIKILSIHSTFIKNIGKCSHFKLFSFLKDHLTFAGLMLKL